MSTRKSSAKNNVLVYGGIMVLALAGMVLVYLGFGYLLPDRWQVDTKRPVTAPAEQVARLVKDFGTWANWSSMDANLGSGTHREIAGQPGSVGQRITWTGSQGMATLTMTTVDSNSIGYDFHLQNPGETARRLSGQGTVRWQGEGSGCVVAWHEDVLLETLPLRWFGWFGALQEKVKQIQGTSLAGLQQTIDATGQTPPPK